MWSCTHGPRTPHDHHRPAPRPGHRAGALMRSSHPAPRGIKQYETHRALSKHGGRPHAGRADLDLDAIIVPASRPAANLDQAITLARAADCWLLIVCSQFLEGKKARGFLAARSYNKAIVVDLPPGYSHPLLDFPGLQSI